MLIAGDIGGTTTRLVLVSPQAGPRKFVAEMNFHSRDYKGLQPIVEEFLAQTEGQATSACFDVAGCHGTWKKQRCATASNCNGSAC
jgi:glucokinase